MVAFKRGALPIVALAFLLRSSNAALRCYVSRTASGVALPTTCPTTSQGCVKLISYDRYDAEIVQKLCGAPEEPQFVYEEGCDTIDVPFKMQKCYCRQELCNGGGITRAEVGLVLALGMSLLRGFATL